MTDTAKTLTLDAPTSATYQPLSLAPPAAVAVVEDSQAEGLLPVEAARKAELSNMANSYVQQLTALVPNSPQMSSKIEEISNVGAQELAQSASVSNRMLERPSSALAGSAGKSELGAQAKTAKSLNDLRTTVVALTPNRADLEGKPVKRFLGLLPGGNKVQAYFDRYKSAQTQLDEITKALASSQDELRKDNAAIDQERSNLWALMGTLTEYTVLLAELNDGLARHADQLDASDPAKAASFRADVIFAVVQRRQDILTQLAVAAQGYLAMDMVKQNNVELIKGVERARTTTLSALRVAVIVAEALTNQKLVLGQIQALNSTTSDVIANNAAMLRQQSAEIQQQASTSTIDIAKLESAFADVFATMDSIDNYRAEAVKSMGATVSALEGQIAKAQPYLERSDSRTSKN